MKINLALTIVLLFSLVVWLVLWAAAGGRESWDTGAYWTLGLPAIYLAGAVAAWVSRVSVWHIVLWSGLGQFAGLLVTASGLSLWPLGLIMLAVLSLPVAPAAWAARRLSNRASA